MNHWQSTLIWIGINAMELFKQYFWCLVFFNFIIHSHCEYDSKWITHFFKALNIGSVNFFGCSNEDSVKAMRWVNQDGSTYSMFGINKQIPDIYPAFTAMHHQIGAFFDFSCNSSKHLFMKVSNELLLNMSFVYLISSDDYDSTITFLQNTTIAYDSNILLAANGYIFDLYRIDPAWDIISTQVGKFKESFTFHVEKLNKRTDLNGTKIKSSLVLMDFPFDGSPEALKRLLDSRYEPELELLSRLGLSLHALLEPVYNFRIEFNVVDVWGEYNKTLGHWVNGMFREIELGNADIGLSISRIFSRRLDAAFYFPSCMTYRSCFIFKHPSTLGTLTALAKPFTIDSWLCTIACVFVSGIFLWYIRKVADEPANESGVTGSILLALGTVCQQGLIKDSYRLPTRVLSFFLLLVSLFIYTFYGAAVVGFLLMPSPRTINTLDKLIQSPLQKYSEDLQYHRIHFKDPFTENIAKTYEAIKGSSPDKDRYIDISSGIKKVQKGKSALYSQDTNLYAVIDKTFKSSEICALAEVEVMVLGSGTVVRKKSPFRELLYRGIMLIRDSGILNRELKKWQTGRPECLALEESTAVTLEATVVAHIIYASGFILSLILFFLEIQFRHKFLTKILSC